MRSTQWICMSLAFPCDPWTRLASLWPEETANKKVEEGNKTLKFVRQRLRAGCRKREMSGWRIPCISGMADAMVGMGLRGFAFGEFQDTHVSTRSQLRRQPNEEADTDRDHDGSSEKCHGKDTQWLQEACLVDRDGTSRKVHRRVCRSVSLETDDRFWWRRGMATSCLAS